MTPIRTIPLPPSISANCSAGVAPQLSEYPEPIGTAGRWVIHPAEYDPSLIDAEDVEHDSALRGLRPEEVELVPPDIDRWAAEHPLVPPARLAAVRGAVPSDLVSDDDAELRKLEAELTARLDCTAVQKMVITLYRRVRAICTAGRSPGDLKAYCTAVEDAIMALPPSKLRPFQRGYDPAHIADGLLRNALADEKRTLDAAAQLHRAGEPAVETD